MASFSYIPISANTGGFGSSHIYTFSVGSPIFGLTTVVTGFPINKSYSCSPALPTGLTLNTTTGAIYGTPSAASAESTYIITLHYLPLQSTTFNLAISIIDNMLPVELNSIVVSGKSVVTDILFFDGINKSPYYISGTTETITFYNVNSNNNTLLIVDSAGTVVQTNIGITTGSNSITLPTVLTASNVYFYLQSNTSNDYSQYAAQVTILPDLNAIAITACSPSSGLTTGGTSVIITGTNLSGDGITSLTFGSNETASFTVTSSTTIIATTPPGSVGKVRIGINGIEFNVFFTYYAPVSNICFPAGTPINTDQGIISIDLIDKNANTIDGQPILHITQTVTLDNYLICFPKNSVRWDYPTQTTIMSKDHKIEYKGRMVPAYRFLVISNIVKKVKYSGEVLYNVLLADYSTIIVNNLVCETLHPDNIIAKLYTSNFSDDYKQNVISIMNDALYRKDGQAYKSIVNRM